MQKIAIIGAGRVGEASAQFIAAGRLCREIALVDIHDGPPKGVALDLQQTGLVLDSDTHLSGSSDYASIAGAGLVIVTAGLPRKPGMSRSDVLESNVQILDSVVEQVMRYAPDSMLLVVSNPVDVLTYRAWKKTGWARNRIFGQAGILDSSRMAAFIASETGLSISDITTMVLGGHGDNMVPLPRYCTINGVPISHFIETKRLDEIIQRTRDGGAEILGLRQNSSAYDAPGVAVTAMVESIVLDRKRLLPCVALLDGEFSQSDIAIGVPCVLGRNGVERVVDLDLDDDERANFEHSVASLRTDMALL
jgi:malate dehydrogenase